MKYCPSHQVIQFMRDGRSPQEACDAVIKSMLSKNGGWFEAVLIAMDNKVS